jgi:hypothetical protein
MPFRPITPTVVSDDRGVSHVITPDEVFADDHPFVKATPTIFVRVDDDGVSAPVVEQATAAAAWSGRGAAWSWSPRKHISDL